MMQTRRQFLTTLSLAGAAGLVRRAASAGRGGGARNDHCPLVKIRGICIAPQYVAEELLRAEGFTDIRYVETAAGRDVRRRSRAARSISA